MARIGYATNAKNIWNKRIGDLPIPGGLIGVDADFPDATKCWGSASLRPWALPRACAGATQSIKETDENTA
jgi:hypothetical protein